MLASVLPAYRERRPAFSARNEPRLLARACALRSSKTHQDTRLASSGFGEAQKPTSTPSVGTTGLARPITSWVSPRKTS